MEIDRYIQESKLKVLSKKDGENCCNSRLTDGQIKSLESSWMPGNESYSSTYIENIHRREKLTPFFEIMSQERVVEIGPGANPVSNYVSCGEYEGVSPHKCHVEGVGERYKLQDGLSYLREKLDRSSIVVSFGVMDEDVLIYGFKNFELSRRYIGELSREIKRVSWPFAIVVGADAKTYMGEADFVRARFTEGGVYVFDKDVKKEMSALR